MRLGVALRIPRAMQDRGWGRYRSTSVDRLAIGKKYRLESQPPVHFKAQATFFIYLLPGKRGAIQLKKRVASLAYLVEHPLSKREVVGSNPTGGSLTYDNEEKFHALPWTPHPGHLPPDTLPWTP